MKEVQGNNLNFYYYYIRIHLQFRKQNAFLFFVQATAKFKQFH